MLNSCGHASLCEECCQRCDICPICRVPVPKTGARTHLRLFYECVEAGLIPKNSNEKPPEEDGENRITTDVQRLYSLFDIALENNLVSLICHCILSSLISSDYSASIPRRCQPVLILLPSQFTVKLHCFCVSSFSFAREELNNLTKLQAYLKQYANHLTLLTCVRILIIFC